MATAMTTVPGLRTTRPYEASSPGVDRNQCEECGAWQRADKADKGLLTGEILHSKNCSSKPQIPSVAAELTKRATQAEDLRLRRFADNVRKHHLTKGRDEDVREAVRRGYLSESDAMNTDD